MSPRPRSVLARQLARHERTRVAQRVLARRKPVVLVAAAFGAPSTCALSRGSALARAFGARMLVVHVVETDSARSRFSSVRAELEERRHLARAQLEALCRGLDIPRSAELVVRDGRFVTAVLDVAFVRAPVLVVVGAAPARAVPERLLRDVECPLWVARPPRSSDAIVAATDLTNDTYPVLRRAADLGARFDAPVTFVSNVKDAVGDRLVESEALLRGVARALGDGVETELLHESRPADAILRVARDRDADLVVVGVRRHARRQGTAGAVVRESLRSVLAVPLAVAGELA